MPLQPDRLFEDSLTVAGLALDYRRGRILPPNSAPEEIGERAHRWTYAVFVAALLHRELAFHEVCPRPTGSSPVQGTTSAVTEHVASTVTQADQLPLNPLSLFRRIVPSAIQDWLGADNALLGEAVRESEDHLIANEEPEIIAESLKVMREHFGVPQSAVAREMRVQPNLLQTLLMPSNTESADNVVSFSNARRTVRAGQEGRRDLDAC